MARQLRLPEIALLVGLSADTVQRKLRAGQIPGYQHASRGPWFSDEEALNQWLRDRTVAWNPTDPNRIEPRSARSQSAISRSA